MITHGSYTELEILILAVIADGIDSGYAIRKYMTRMRGSRWSAESGSVYRVLRRLESDGLVFPARRAGVPNRERTEYELSPQGELVVKSWLSLPPDRGEMMMLVDPIRTRSLFLEKLPTKERIAVVSMWLAQSHQFLEEVESELRSKSESDAMKALANENLLYLAKGRHEWLKKLSALVRRKAKSEKSS